MLGASFDTPEDNKSFADAQGFAYRLLSDRDHEVGQAYQARRDPQDERADYPRRVAYLIDADGIVRNSYDVTDTAAFASMVVDDLRRLRLS